MGSGSDGYPLVSPDPQNTIDTYIGAVARFARYFGRSAQLLGKEDVRHFQAHLACDHRVSAGRLVELEDGRVSFRYKAYDQGGEQRVLPLDTVVFLRRFLLHALPQGLVRIRQYGLRANCCRRQKIDRCRELIGDVTAWHHRGDDSNTDSRSTAVRFPVCRVGAVRA